VAGCLGDNFDLKDLKDIKGNRDHKDTKPTGKLVNDLVPVVLDVLEVHFAFIEYHVRHAEICRLSRMAARLRIPCCRGGRGRRPRLEFEMVDG